MNNSNFAVLRDIFHRLPRRRKRQLGSLLCGGVVLALVEMASVGTLALMAAVISDPASIASSRFASLESVQHILKKLSYPTLVLCVSAAALLLLTCKNALSACIVYANATICSLIDAYFGEIIIQNILTRPYTWLLGKSSSDLFTLASWRRHVGSGVLFMAIQLICSLMVIGILLLGLLLASPIISILLLGGAGLAGWGVFRLFRVSSSRTGTRLKQLEAIANRSLTTVLQGAKDVKIFGLEQVFQTRFASEACQYAWSEGKYRLLARLPSMYFEVLGFAILFIAITIFLFLHQASSASSLLGFLTLLTVAAWRVLNAVNQVLASLSSIRLELPPVRRILELLHQDVPQPSLEDTPFSLQREIHLDHVTFTYPNAGRPALQQIAFTIPKGMCLGVVGRSGSGKSTLADMLLGLLSPESGSIAVDGRTLTPSSIPSWMHRIGYVGQTPYLLDASLKENVAFGIATEAIDDDRVRECCRLALVDEFLPSLPRGLDTPLGEGGGNLSGGQRQRVAIARALYRRPELLILDEATSALDMQSENALRRTVQELTGRYTLVIIAHRLTAVEPCQALLWLDQGAVKAFGARDEILDRYTRAMGDAAV